MVLIYVVAILGFAAAVAGAIAVLKISVSARKILFRLRTLTREAVLQSAMPESTAMTRLREELARVPTFVLATDAWARAALGLVRGAPDAGVEVLRLMGIPIEYLVDRDSVSRNLSSRAPMQEVVCESAPDSFDERVPGNKGSLPIALYKELLSSAASAPAVPLHIDELERTAGPPPRDRVLAEVVEDLNLAVA